MERIKKIRLSSLSIFIVALVCIIIDLNCKSWEKQKGVIKDDVLDCYSYLPAKFIYHDIKLEKSDYQLEDDYSLFSPINNSDGKKVIKGSMGLSFLYAPFFFAAHIYSIYSDYPENGFSEPYKIFLLLSSVFYLLVGFEFLRKILLFFNLSDRNIALTILLIGLGTNILCYASQSAGMPPVYNFCLFAMFVWYSIKWHETLSMKTTIILGLLLGIITLINPSNLLLVIFFSLYGIEDWNGFKMRFSLFRKEAYLLNVILFFAFLVWIPQFLYWKEVTGSYFYSSLADQRFFFNHPRILDGLFSFRKGWLIYTPLIIVPIIGLLFMKGFKSTRLALLLFIATNIYLTFSWWCWWYGNTFGQSSMVASYSLLAIPLGFSIKFVSEKNIITNIFFYSLCAFFVWLNIFQTFQYEYSSLHPDGMTKELYFKQFGTLSKISNYDTFVADPNYKEAKLGKDCNSFIENKDRNSFGEREVIGKKTIYIKASNKKYVCADESASDNILANKDTPSTWETFTLVLFKDHKCALISFKNKFLSAELQKTKEITATRDFLSSWEIFTLEKQGGNRYSLKASNNLYISLNDQNFQLVANSETMGERETFLFESLLL